jgi:hypothetical protein
MLMPREGSLLLAASGSLRIVCEASTVNLAWNLIFGITRPDHDSLETSNLTRIHCIDRGSRALHLTCS